MAITIAVAHSKGGVGKTTVSLNLASGLARSLHGKGKVVLLDFDVQATATNVLSCKQKNDFAPQDTLATLLAGDTLLQMFGHPRGTVDRLARKPLVGREDRPGWPDNLFFVPTLPDYLRQIERADPRLYDRHDAVERLAQRIRGAPGFDIVLIDTNATMNDLTLLALQLADFVLTPTEPLMGSVDDLTELTDELDRTRKAGGQRPDGLGTQVELLGIVVNKYRPTYSQVDGPVVEQLREAYGERVFRAMLPAKAAVERATTNFVDVWVWGERHADQDERPAFNAFMREFNRRLETLLARQTIERPAEEGATHVH